MGSELHSISKFSLTSWEEVLTGILLVIESAADTSPSNANQGISSHDRCAYKKGGMVSGVKGGNAIIGREGNAMFKKLEKYS